MSSVAVIPVPGLPAIRPGDDLPHLLLDAIDAARIGLKRGDMLAVCQKVVSKAEGSVVLLSEVEPSPFARAVAATVHKDPRLVEVILRETRRIVRMDRGHLICETAAGFVCANAGVDESNSLGPDTVVLLPRDPDASAEAIRAVVASERGVAIGAVVTDTFGRPWREGLVEIALGVAGIEPLLDLRGRRDLAGRELHHTVVAVADEIAAAAGLVMLKDSGVAAAIVRGATVTPGAGGARRLVRPAASDLFR